MNEMKVKTKIFAVMLNVLLSLVFLNVGVGKAWAESVKLVNAALKKDFVIGEDSGDENHFLQMPARVLVNNGKLYVLDVKACCVNIYDSNSGKFISSFSGKGAGPKELLDPYAFTISNKKIYISNQGNSRIEIFNLDGTYSGSFKLLDQPWDIGADRYGNIWIVFKKGNNLVHIYTPGGKLIKSMISPSTEKDFLIAMFMNRVKLVMGENDEFFVVSQFKNKIDKYNKDGKLLFSTRRPLTTVYEPFKSSKREVSDDGDKKVVSMGAEVLTIGAVFRNKVLYLITWQGKKEADEKKVLVDMIDNSGKYLGSFKIPISCNSMYFDSQNKAYFIESNESFITKGSLWVAGQK